MIKCNNCGYENNDGSTVCLNCRKVLETTGDSFSPKVQHTSTAKDLYTSNTSKKPIAILITVLIIIVGAVIYFSNPSNAVDDKLLGTWQTRNYTSVGCIDVWTFKRNGTYTMSRTFSNPTIDKLNGDGYYSAEKGVLKTSFSKNVKDYTTATYTYSYGVSDDGCECIILKHSNSPGKDILYKVY